MSNIINPNRVSTGTPSGTFSGSRVAVRMMPESYLSSLVEPLNSRRKMLAELSFTFFGGRTRRPLKSTARRNWSKYALDSLLILFALPLLLPLFALIAILIKLDSHGPIFHRRRVLGLGGRTFDALKFRTMYINGDEILEQYPALKAELELSHKLKQDPRITCVGAILRKLSLDELPQLLNVLIGQMSLVGPRMISPSEAANYGEHQDELLTVVPGLTGLWQVSGRSDLSYQERVLLDMKYIRDYSLSLDLDILFFRTLPAVLKGEGAY